MYVCCGLPEFIHCVQRIVGLPDADIVDDVEGPGCCHLGHEGVVGSTAARRPAQVRARDEFAGLGPHPARRRRLRAHVARAGCSATFAHAPVLGSRRARAPGGGSSSQSRRAPTTTTRAVECRVVEQRTALDMARRRLGCLRSRWSRHRSRGRLHVAVPIIDRARCPCPGVAPLCGCAGVCAWSESSLLISHITEQWLLMVMLRRPLSGCRHGCERSRLQHHRAPRVAPARSCRSARSRPQRSARGGGTVRRRAGR